MTPQRCASYHLGVWLIEPEWFAAAVRAVEAGIIRAAADTVDPEDERSEGPAVPYLMVGSVALIPIVGAMMKPRSKYGGTSTIDVRRAVRHAVEDDAVTSVVLHLDSPGGTMAGCDALARDVAAADKAKPVYAHADDMLGSAAYYVASQARRLTASPTSLVGSLGARLALVDSSRAAEKAGYEVIDVSTGEFKGAGLDGTKITDRQREYFQGIVDRSGEHFKLAVMRGRRMGRERADALFDGKMHDAEVALALGLIDAVTPLDDVLVAAQRDHPPVPEQPEIPPAPAISGHGATVAYPAAVTRRSTSYAAQPR